LVLPTGWNSWSERPWMAVGACDPITVCYGLVFASVASHCSSAFFCVVCLIVFETQFTAFLHSESLFSCHNFLILFLYFNSWSRPGRSLFNSDKVTLLVESRYPEAIDAVKARTTLSASTQS
jgi:hypothetical protein